MEGTQAAHSGYLEEVFSQFTTTRLTNISPAEFKARIEAFLGAVDYRQEGFTEAQAPYQRDLTIKFHWGHNHDFGAFRLAGRMRDRHLFLMNDFLSYFSLSPEEFSGRRVLDVGCWTGGTSLLLLGMGAEVTAIEEVAKYAEAAQFLIDSFGLEHQGRVLKASVYELPKLDLHERFDMVYVPGVVYHLSDPVLALRHLCNALRLGGLVLVESAGLDSEQSVCRFEGSRIHHVGAQAKLSRGGWNWFLPSQGALEAMMVEAGFDDVEALYSSSRKRLYAIGRKAQRHDICRAGLSVPDVI